MNDMNESPSAAQEKPWVRNVRRFLAECTEYGRGYEVRSVELWAAYDAWCAREDVPTISVRRFSPVMRTIGFWPHKRSVMLWQGLRLKPEPVLAPDDPLAG